MGSYIYKNRVIPRTTKEVNSLLDSLQAKKEVSRVNFRFINKFAVYGVRTQSIIWIAQNIDDPAELFFVKQSDKYLLYNNKRIQSLKRQLNILTLPQTQSYINSKTSPFNSVYFAFQDYEYIYLVTDYVDGFTLTQVLQHHLFSQEETKYVMMTLIDIIDFLHSHGYALGELDPNKFIVNRHTGSLHLFELGNLLKINQYYPAQMVTKVSIYSAPECVIMDKVLSQSDFYSLGLLMYQMMTQKKPMNPQTEGQAINRNIILNQSIKVVQSDVPQGWSPQAADFLVRLLFKNPNLRLGRYGSFQVRNHPWIQNSNDWEPVSTKSKNININTIDRSQIKIKTRTSKDNRLQGSTSQKYLYQKHKANNHISSQGYVNLSQQFFSSNKPSTLQTIEKLSQLSEEQKKKRQQYLQTFFFQQLFENYEYKISMKTYEEEQRVNSKKSDNEKSDTSGVIWNY